MRRPLLLVSVAAGAFTGLVLLLTLLTVSPAIARSADSPGSNLDGAQAMPEAGAGADPRGLIEPEATNLNQALPLASLSLEVNYGHDWVAGLTDFPANVAVTVTDSTDAVKETAVVSADGSGNFFVDCPDWDSGNCPDILPGDKVTATVPGATAAVNPIGSIIGQLDEASDTVTGTLNANWFSGTLSTTCQVWADPGSDPIITSANADGGSFSCDFSSVGWVLQRGDMVALSYFESDGDQVINILQWPWVRVNYAEDWVGADYPAGHTFWLTATESGGAVKGTATIDSAPGSGWDGDGLQTEDYHWTPGMPDIVPGDWVYFASSDGYDNALRVGTISGTLDIAADSLGGPIFASWLSGTLPVDCQPWSAWETGLDVTPRSSSATADGLTPFSCDWSGEWDIQLGDRVAVVYFEEDGDAIIDVYAEPAPDMAVEKWPEGNPQAAPGEVTVFNIQYRNEGDVPAATVVLTDTLSPGLTYLTHTSGFSPTVNGNQVVWTFGPVEPGQEESFRLVALVDSSPAASELNIVDISTPFDSNPDNDHSESPVDIVSELPDLYVNKYATPNQPTTGETYLYGINYGNNGPVPAGPVVLTDTLPTGVSVVGWYSQNGYDLWTEQSSNGQLVLTAPAVPGFWGDQLLLRVRIDEAVEIDTQLVNTVEIQTPNEANPDDNDFTDYDTWVGSPQWNGGVNKQFSWGLLYPEGQIQYHLQVRNDGSMPASFWLSDTLPADTYFMDAWAWSGPDYLPFPYDTINGNTIGWNIGLLEPGEWFDIDLLLGIALDFPVDETAVNCAEVVIDGPDSWPADDISCVAEGIFASGANLRVTKRHEWEGPNWLRYEINFANIGTESVTDVWITDTIPFSTTYFPDSGWEMDFDWERMDNFNFSGDALTWHFTELFPGDSGWLHFRVMPDSPGEPLRWYTNTAEITEPPGDTNPGDNVYEDLAFSGGEVWRVELQVGVDNSSIWGEAIPEVPVTVTTSLGQFTTSSEPDCGCWNIGDAGPVYPGDTITVTAANGTLPVVIEVPDPFSAEANSTTDMVSGQIGGVSEEYVEVNLDDGQFQVVPTDGAGNYAALFENIPRGGSGEVRYRTEVSYAEVVYHRWFVSPDLILRVNYGHDWIEGHSVPDATVQITLTDSSMSQKAATSVTADGDGNFLVECDTWALPDCPDIMPLDWVLGSADNGFSTDVQVGFINGTLNGASDVVSGTIDAPWFTDPLYGECNVWVEGGPGFSFEILPDGLDTYDCDFSSMWVLLPGQDVGVTYQEPDGDWVINVFAEPAPYLRINKYSLGLPDEGANLVFRIEYWNDGGAAAENVVITDTLEGMTYLTDTLDASSSTDGQQTTWLIDNLPENSRGFFDVYVSIIAAASEMITNTAEIATDNLFDQGDPSEKISVWVDQVGVGGTDLHVDKQAWTGDPAPDETMVFEIQVCNDTEVGSAWTTMTDTFELPFILDTWWASDPVWTPLSETPTELVVTNPSIPGNYCSTVFASVFVDPGAEPGTPVSNTAVIDSGNDGDPGNNESTWWGEIGSPHTNLSINKQWNWGFLMPGGEIRYNISYHNNGNVPVDGPIYITDTLPADTTFGAAWIYDQQGNQTPFPPLSSDAGTVIWMLDGLENGFGGNFEIVLLIDGGAKPGAVLTNTVEITPQPEEDDYQDNTSQWVETVFPFGPQLRIRKDGGWHGFGDGHNAWFNLSVENVGDETIPDVIVVDLYPPEMELDGEIMFDWHQPWDWVNDPANHTFTVTLGSLNPGEVANIGFNTIIPGEDPVTPGLILVNQAWVTLPPEDTNPDDNTDVALLATGPDLYVEKVWVDGVPLAGEMATFLLHYGNDRPGHEWWWGLQGDALLTDTLPAGLEYVYAELLNCGPSGEPCPYDPIYNDGSQLVWSVGPLSAGEWQEMLLTVRITDTAVADQVLTNWAEISSNSPAVDAEVDYENNSDSADLVVVAPAFELEKVYQTSQIAGLDVTYTITVTNVGDGPGLDVVLQDLLPEGLTFQDSDGHYDGATGIISWTFDLVPSGGGQVAGWFRATLPCTETFAVVNDAYGVVSSLGGITAEGTPVNFNTIAPTINASLSHTPGPLVVGSTAYFTGSASTNGLSLVNYIWDFDDGTGDTGLTASHVYTQDGLYIPSFTAVDVCGYSGSAFGAITIEPPTIVVSFSQSTAIIPITGTVYFTDASTTNGPPIVTWEWDFGDGSPPSTEQNPSHIFDGDGTFDITLTVTDLYGYSNSWTKTEAITVLAPSFRISKVYEGNQVAGTTVTYTLAFTNQGDYPGTGLLIIDPLPAGVSYLSGGTFNTVTEVISWTYERLDPGLSSSVQFTGQLACSGPTLNENYRVRESDQGVASPKGPDVTFDILAPTLSAVINHSADPAVGSPVIFTATVNTDGPLPETLEWDLGDGTTASGLTAEHIYATTDTYTVTFTATDSCGYQAVQTTQLDVGTPNIQASFNQNTTEAPIHSTFYFTDTTVTNGTAIVAWLWDFGDGSQPSTAQNPSHTYNLQGAFVVSLTVTDTLGYSGSTAGSATTLAPVFEIGKAFESSQVAKTPVTYTLTITNSGDYTGTGLLVTDLLPEGVSYVSGGSYDSNTQVISWTVDSLAPDLWTDVQFTGELACSGSAVNDTYQVADSDLGMSSPLGSEVSFPILGPTITADFGHSTGPVAGATVYFTGTASSNGSPLTNYDWGFGDGLFGTGLETTHVYAADGAYSVVFTATDGCGYTGTQTVELNVIAPTIEASFDQSEEVVLATDPIYFTDTTTTNGSVIAGWLWDFGDGSQPSNTQNPSHAYTERGTFTVTLTVTDTYGYGDSVTLPNAITVQAPAFTIDKTYDSSEIAGLSVTYTLTLTNGGDVTATNIIITDLVPSEVSWVNGGDYDLTSGVVSWLADSLAVGTSTSVSFNGDLACSGSAVNDEYRVAGSDQGGQSPWGLPVSFDIQAPTITADFNQSDSEINSGDTVMFTSTSSTNGTGLTYHWDFGDGQTSDSGPVVSHTYTESGNYVVTLTVTDGCDYEAEVTSDLLVRFMLYLPVIIKSD